MSPKRMENSPEKSFGSGNLSPSSTASKASGMMATRIRRPCFSNEGMDDFYKQIIQSLQCGESTGMVAIEAISCLPFCVALFPNCHLISLLTGTTTTVLSLDNTCTVTWSRFLQDLIFSRSELLRYAGLYGLYQMITLSPLPTIDLPDPLLGDIFLSWTSEPTLHIVQLLFSFLSDIIQVLLFPAREQTDFQPMADAGASLSDHLLSGVFELLLALAKRDPSAVLLLSSQLYCSCFPDDFDLSTYSWQYSPPAIHNQSKGISRFVGLRNGGATCYMNSILQQLFSLIPIRNAVLVSRPEQRLQQETKSAEITTTVAEVTATDSSESGAPIGSDSTEFSSVASNGTTLSTQSSPDQKDDDSKKKKLTADQIHHLKVLFHTQSIFGHLTLSLLQSYKPVEFWQEFRFSSEQLNIREQHDAVEFMQTVCNDLDEALYLCNMPKAVEQVLGGTFADQKLCIDCPHRYSRNESFTILSVDIRNHTNLLQSLEQYVKGDRLEGDNAYWCEACNAKVTTLKRMCIDRLPLVLAIQLKRFDYDWDRDMAIKFNDYFEFPRELDMYPYTVQGLGQHVPEAKMAFSEVDPQEQSETTQSGTIPPPGSNLSVSPDPQPESQERDNNPTCTRYTLRGVVVHSGQAGGGHYYSFIRQYCPKTKTYRWYKYDDTEVSVVPMDNEDEARAQWFGGEDPYSWTSKRWWCAYILFYEREDFQSQLPRLSVAGDAAFSTTANSGVTPRVKKIVHRENVEYLHQQMQFHPLLSDFILNMTRASLDMCAVSCLQWPQRSMLTPSPIVYHSSL
ncbi:unnamed protein product [Echinostoma caproni]|uniref:Ubiquitin carboxyl-terminal hydrolase n=1 Tax=Echinostoma caproni TaxID=27848 RepID=A0A3P8KYB0_9TREM|nr:unnamed protein product [Echinostoma caproni]